MISVVIPLYNKESSIAAAINSVLSQSFQDFEIIVIDDGSTDDSAHIVGSFTDHRIRLISQTNAGVSEARNKGIAEAKGEFIALLDGDDLWKPEFLATMYTLSERYPECSVFAVDYESRNKEHVTNGTIINKLPFTDECGLLTNYFEVAAYSNPPICSISIMVRASAFKAIGGFPTGIRSGEDLLTWARLACRFKIAYSRRVLAIFNVEGYNVNEPPKRIPANEDIVGRELAALDAEYSPEGIKEYRAMWHKMRASVYMRLRMRRKSIREAVKGIRLNPRNFKLYAFIALNCLPSKLQPF